MKLVDANVLLYAVNADERPDRHEPSKAWLDEALAGAETVGFSWIVLLAFLRLVTKIGLFPRPLSVEDAGQIVSTWLSQPAAVIVEPTGRHLSVLTGLLVEAGTGGNLVSDAHLAALAVEHHATVVTFDRDFARFRGIRLQTPGVETG